MNYKSIWVFNSPNSRFSGGVFEELEIAEGWIKRNSLTGILTKYPINIGTLEWAIENDLVNMKQEKLNERIKDPNFIGGFTSASMDHFHYEDGKKTIKQLSLTTASHHPGCIPPSHTLPFYHRTTRRGKIFQVNSRPLRSPNVGRHI